MLDIRYEDEALLIVNKPPGILVHPTTKEDETTLSAQISRYYQQQGWQLNLHPVSRLDRQTSGLVVFAKLPEIQGKLMETGQHHRTGNQPRRQTLQNRILGCFII